MSVDSILQPQPEADVDVDVAPIATTVDQTIDFTDQTIPKNFGRGRRGLALDWTLAILIGIASAWHMWPGIASSPFFRDEARWINNSQIIDLWLHPLSDKWQDSGYSDIYQTVDEAHRRSSQPPMGSYVIGLGILIQEGRLANNGYWIMNFDTNWNAENGNMPSPADLRAARRTNVIVAALTAMAVFAICSSLTNRAGGIAGGLLFGFHPLTMNISTEALSDPTVTLFVALAAFAAIRFAQRPTWGRAAIFGAMLGLGGSAKLSPLLLTVPVGLLALVILVDSRRRNGTWRPFDSMGVRLFFVPAFAGLTFVASYPYLWPNPIVHTYRLFHFRTESFTLQGDAFPPAKVAGTKDAFRRVGVELGTRFSDARYIAEQVDRHLGTHIVNWAGIVTSDLAFATIGGLMLVFAAFKFGLRSAQLLALLVLGGLAAAIVLTMGVEYARYLMPVMLAETAMLGFLVGVIFDVASHQINRLRSERFQEELAPAA